MNTIAYNRKPLFGRARWEQEVAEQRAWVAERGGDLVGYLAWYGARSRRPVHEIQAIYGADTAALAKAERRLAECR